MSQRFSDCDACVDAILARVGPRIVLGTPLGIGKPNALLNALYRRVKQDPALSLDLITALSLNPPRGASELEERFLAPVRARVWKDYPRLEFLDDLEAARLPPNVRVIQFYARSGSILRNPQAQQDYISTNYTHVARDMVTRGANLLMQSIAVREGAQGPRYSLSSNPDVTLQVVPMLKEAGLPVLSVAQVNRELPWMGNRAEVAGDFFDFVLDDPQLDHAPFAVPHEPVGAADWAIGLHASRLVRDGGTLQVGIGALGDAACHALRLRDRDNATYRATLEALGADAADGAIEAIGGRAPFAIGLYVASELISNALFSLFEDGVVRRRVFEDEAEQKRADLAAPVEGLRGGTTLQGAFFIGPGDFYRRLRALPDEQLALIDMTSVAEVNRIYTHYALERAQRRHARFINITMKATLLGAAISDQLGDGQVVSGVGGQHDFVVMAHQLPEGRSVLLLRATRGSGRKLESNLVWEFPHATVPRHERDLFVTEYGVADLRGRTDRECIEAMIAIADGRFQEVLASAAKRAGKLPKDWRIPDRCRGNDPARIAAALKPFQQSGALPKLPFGNDLTPGELAIAEKLGKLKSASRVRLLRALLVPASVQTAEAALNHLELAWPETAKEKLLARLVRAAYVL